MEGLESEKRVREATALNCDTNVNFGHFNVHLVQKFTRRGRQPLRPWAARGDMMSQNEPDATQIRKRKCTAASMGTRRQRGSPAKHMSLRPKSRLTRWAPFAPAPPVASLVLARSLPAVAAAQLPWQRTSSSSHLGRRRQRRGYVAPQPRVSGDDTWLEQRRRY